MVKYLCPPVGWKMAQVATAHHLDSTASTCIKKGREYGTYGRREKKLRPFIIGDFFRIKEIILC